MSEAMAEKNRKVSKEKRDALRKKIEELEDIIRYYDAMIEEIYETQEAMFPIFVDLVKLISRLYKEVKIEDDEMKNRINRLEETFTEKSENILKKYLKDNDDFTVAYT
ncbi:MAG: hypothetical protein J7L31_01285 [Thermoplasmata archaeon]|jgi:gas vesicle protein|nr:hypothetical protein [Thermoplasmata archaeon]